MKNVKKIISVALIGILALSVSACDMISKTPEAIRNTVVAKVGNDKVTKGEVDDAMKPVLDQIKQQYGSDYEKNDTAKQQVTQQKQQVLEELITKKITFQKAKDLKLMPTDAELKKETDTQIDSIKDNLKKQAQDPSKFDDAAFKDALKQQGYTEDSLRKEISDNVVMKKVYDNATKDIKVDDKEIQDYYDKNKDTEFTEKPNQIHAAHILVKTEDEAKKVEERLANKEDFAALAKELSQDTGTKDNGGDLGTVPYSSLVPEFVNAAKALKEGEISKPVQSQYGWHVIKLIKKEEYPVKKLDAVKDDIKTKVLQQKQSSQWQTTIQKWETDMKVKRYTDKL